MTGRGWIILAALGAVLPVSAQWQLIDDFERIQSDIIWEEAEEIGWLGSGTNLDEYWILPSSDYVQDSEDTNNMALYVPSIHTTQLPFTPVCAIKALPGQGIPAGESGVVYFRCFSLNSFESEWSIGVSDKDLSYDDNSAQLVSPRGWSDYNVNIQFTTERVLEHRDGNAYVKSNPQWETVENDWTEFWIVIENTWDAEGNPEAFTGGFTVYAKKPGDADPVLIKVGTNPAKDRADFRRIPSNDSGAPSSIKWLMLTVPLSVTGNVFGDLFLLDDFYFSQGENLSSPLDWVDYTIEPSGDVDTGDWLGWINVSQAPYILSYSNGWFWMDESTITESGAWAYFFK